MQGRRNRVGSVASLFRCRHAGSTARLWSAMIRRKNRRLDSTARRAPAVASDAAATAGYAPSLRGTLRGYLGVCVREIEGVIEDAGPHNERARQGGKKTNEPARRLSERERQNKVRRSRPTCGDFVFCEVVIGPVVGLGWSEKGRSVGARHRAGIETSCPVSYRH